MIAVGTYPTRNDDAELAQMLLWAAGVPYEISVHDTGGASPFDLTGGVRLLVEERDAEDARSVLNDRPAI